MSDLSAGGLRAGKQQQITRAFLLLPPSSFVIGMARSPSVSYDEDSGLSVNSSVDSANLKKEKMAAKRFQPNNRVPNGDVEMAATQRIPDSQEHVEEDEGYGPSASDDDESPSARKRQRVNEDGDDVEDPQLQTTRRIIAPLIRDPIDG